MQLTCSISIIDLYSYDSLMGKAQSLPGNLY